MYDLAVIGAGWAGLNCALRAKKLGLKVCLIEKNKLGGTCLNKGCIPTKTLLRSAKLYNLTKKIDAFGIKISNCRIDFKYVKERKNLIIQRLSKSIENSLRGIELILGEAKFLDNHTLEVSKTQIKAKSIVIATGAEPQRLNWAKNYSHVVTSDDILEIENIPKNLLIIGAGVIGCEFASIFNFLETEVEIVELKEQILPGEDKELAKRLESIFKKRGIRINTSQDVRHWDLDKYELVLVCIGRTPQIKNLNLDVLGIKTKENFILVDDNLSTNIKNIYACGDCLGKNMFAHFASFQGRLLAERLAENKDISLQIREAVIPHCIFTDPEFASVGLSEEEARSLGKNIKVNKFDFLGIGMSHILEEREGLIKVISDKETEKILGASIIGPLATELINIFSLAIKNNLKIKDFKQTIFAHPTLSEIITESFKE